MSLEVIDNVFTKEECEDLIKKAESIGFKTIDRSIALYDRVIMTDKKLADHLYNKYKNIIPEYIDGERVVGINDHFRFSKYHIGGKFDIHLDAFNTDSNGNISRLTFNIFLNEDFEGGETDFYEDDAKTLRCSVKPKTGRGALFYSQQYHCGNKVTKGNKYLIRTDVMTSIL